MNFYILILVFRQPFSKLSYYEPQWRKGIWCGTVTLHEKSDFMIKCSLHHFIWSLKSPQPFKPLMHAFMTISKHPRHLQWLRLWVTVPQYVLSLNGPIRFNFKMTFIFPGIIYLYTCKKYLIIVFFRARESFDICF